MAHSFPYSYLVGSLLFVPLWIALYRGFPGLRREMLVMSGLFLCIGVPMEGLLYTKDWWHPVTITGTTVGIEDVVYSIGNGGYLATLYAVAFRSQSSAVLPPPPLLYRLAPVAAIVILPLLGFYALGLHSFVATSVGSLVALALILPVRPDLLKIAILSGLIGTAIAMPVYLAIEAFFPGSIAATWYLDRLSGLLLLGIPVEDLVWYLYTGALWGVYFKFATGRQLVASRGERFPIAT